MEQLLLERPSFSVSNIPESLKHLFSVENPLEFVKETVNLTKNLTIDEDKKKATLELKKELKYQVLTIEMDEDERFVYSIKKISKKAGIKLVYNLKPEVQLPLVDLKKDKFERSESLIKLATAPTIELPTIPIPDFVVTQNIPLYGTNVHIPLENNDKPSYQEILNPLKNYNENKIIERDTDFLTYQNDLIDSIIEIPKIDPDIQIIEYKKPGFQINNYNTPKLNEGEVYQKISLDNHSIIPGASVYESLINAGLDIETSYHKIWGTSLDGINGIKNDDQYYWGLFVNGKAPSTAIDKIKLKKDDNVELLYTEMSKGSCFAGRNITDFYEPKKDLSGNDFFGLLELPGLRYN